MSFFPPQGAASAAAAGGGGLDTSTSHTTSATLSTSGFNDNTGASGTITLTFDDTAARNAVITRVATQEVRIAPASGKTITWSGGTMGTDEYLRLLADDAVVWAYVTSAGNVVVISEFGAIAEQTP